MNSVLVKKLEWNLHPNYVANLLLICHIFATGTKLPGAVAHFNRQIVEAVTFNFRQLFLVSDY